jgi:hypothetical protein
MGRAVRAAVLLRCGPAAAGDPTGRLQSGTRGYAAPPQLDPDTRTIYHNGGNPCRITP